MNAIIALCHFCELHGPSVLFCTQAFHESDDPQKVLKETKTTQEKRYYGKPQYYWKSSGPSSLNLDSNKVSDTCEACRSLEPFQSEFICNDHEAKVSYLSSQYPHHPEIFSMVRQACVRSLSCEVCPGREGPIFFGDEHRGHVFSHTFFLKDSEARGFQRWYSIIVVMMDKIFLLNSWPFLLKHIQTVINELQEKAFKVYEEEQAKCPQRALRLNNVTSMTPGNFRRQRGGTRPMRSLKELTNDKDIFASLHLWFTWILKAGGNRLTEKLLEGPPTEDTVIDLEKQEETEEGFMLVVTKKVPKEYSRQLETDDVNNSPKETPTPEKGPVVENIRQLYQFLHPDDFHVLAYHVLIGNQIIVCGNNKNLIASFIKVLQVLLPRGCFSPVFYSEEYQDSYKCNFLGLPADLILPPHVMASDLYICIDLKPKNDTPQLLEDYEVFLQSIAVLPEKCPAILLKMEKAIQDPNLSDRVLDYFFTSLKEEWMNKVKVLFKFSRAASRTQEDTQKMLHVLGAQDQDKQVLKFWMTGLSSQFKTHILSATMSQCHGNEGAS